MEVAEPGGQKWSKPHVSTLSMHSLFQLRDLLLNAVVLLDETGKDMPQIAGVGCGVGGDDGRYCGCDGGGGDDAVVVVVMVCNVWCICEVAVTKYHKYNVWPSFQTFILYQLLLG